MRSVVLPNSARTNSEGGRLCPVQPEQMLIFPEWREIAAQVEAALEQAFRGLQASKGWIRFSRPRIRQTRSGGGHYLRIFIAPGLLDEACELLQRELGPRFWVGSVHRYKAVLVVCQAGWRAVFPWGEPGPLDEWNGIVIRTVPRAAVKEVV